MVHLHLLPRATQLTGVGEESLDQLCAPTAPDTGRIIIEEDRRGLACERNAAPVGHQRGAVVPPRDGDTQSLPRAMLRLERGPVAVVNRRSAAAELPCQRLDEGPLHDPFEPPELVPIEGQLIVLHHTPILALKLADDTKVGINDAFRAAGRFAVVQVGGAFRADHVQRHFQPDPPIDAAVAALIVLVVVSEDHDFVAEETCRVSASVRNHGLLRGEFQLEMLTQEVSDAVFDLLGFLPGTAESEQPIIRIAQVAQAPIARIIRITRGEALELLAQRRGFFLVAPLFPAGHLQVQAHVRAIGRTSFAAVVVR